MHLLILRPSRRVCEIRRGPPNDVGRHVCGRAVGEVVHVQEDLPRADRLTQPEERPTERIRATGTGGCARAKHPAASRRTDGGQKQHGRTGESQVRQRKACTFARASVGPEATRWSSDQGGARALATAAWLPSAIPTEFRQPPCGGSLRSTRARTSGAAVLVCDRADLASPGQALRSGQGWRETPRPKPARGPARGFPGFVFCFFWERTPHR